MKTIGGERVNVSKVLAIIIFAMICRPALNQAAEVDGSSTTIQPCEARGVMRTIQDKTLRKAIQQSQETLPNFFATFAERAKAQTDFMVVTLEDTGDAYAPVGILVNKVEKGTVSGDRMPNGLEPEPEPAGPMSCSPGAIVDWRYTDTFEMVGGRLYRELLGRQHRRVQFTIANHLPFLVHRKEAIDPKLLQLFRDIANGRPERLRKLSKKELSMNGLTADMPTRWRAGSSVKRTYPTTIPEYTASYGNRALIDLLWERGALAEERGKFPLLTDSSASGNLETTTRLLELGFDPNDIDEFGYSPLHQAARRDHIEIARRLLRHDANCNFRDRGENTPLFHVVSPEFAELLIESGADVNAKDDNGRTCHSSHLHYRRMDIAKVLARAGAKVDSRLEKFFHEESREEEEIIADGRDSIIEFLKASGNTEGLAEFLLAESVDCGFVLPVRSLPKSSQ